MADLRKFRKSKLVPRHYEDDNLQDNPGLSSSNSRSTVFDVKVEIESCDEDSFSIENDLYTQTQVKTEPVNEYDLFEAEENDINQLALTLVEQTGKNVENQYDCNITFEIDNDEQDFNVTTSLSQATRKRKRVPNIKKEYVYNNDDVKNLLKQKIGPKKLKSKKENPSKDYKKDKEISKVKSVWKTRRCDEQHIKLMVNEEVLIDEIKKLTDKSKCKVDEILQIEAINLWGKMRYVTLTKSEQQVKLQVAIREWTKFNMSRDEFPVMYKCYVCEKAWWHLRPFSDHIQSHEEPELKVQLEFNEMDSYIVAFHYESVPKFFPIIGNCWRCGNDWEFHSKSSMHKYGKFYGCESCNTGFHSCRKLREHQGKCLQTLIKEGEAHKVNEINQLCCSICPYRVLKTAPNVTVLQNHMKDYHDVRSDIPIGISNAICLHCRLCIPTTHYHACSRRSRSFKCQFCNRRFPSQMSLDVHIQSSPSDYKCRFCDVVLDKRCMEPTHLVVHSKLYTVMYKCATCVGNLLAMDLHAMKKHRTIIHKKKHDGRRNFFEPMLVPKDFVEAELKANGCLENDSDTYDFITDETSLSSVIEVNDSSDEQTDVKVKQEKPDSDDEVYLNIKKEAEMVEQGTSYEQMLSRVFHASGKEVFQIEIKEEKEEETPMVVENELSEKKLGRPEDWPKPRYKRSRKLYRCPECDFTGSLAKTKHHLFKRHKRKIDPKASEAKFYECSKCLREFADLSSYCEHLVHHGFEPMSCPECMASFPSYSKLVDHVKARTLVSLQRTQFFTKKREGAQLIIKYHCRKCKQEVRPNNKFAHWESHLEIRDFSELLIPKVEIDEGNASVCDDELDVNEQEEQALPLGPDMLKQVIAAVLLKNNNKECMVCKRIFDRKNDAKRHLIEHLLQDAYCNMYKSKSLKCQICHDGFGHSLDYKLHMRAHGGMPVYQCPDCGKSFSDSSNYTKHKKTHAIDTHACAVCGRKFLASISLDRHMELHEAAPINCPNCSLTFLTEAEFNRHSRTKHNSSKLKYRCVICKKRFESLRARWDHSWLAHRERKLQADCHICGQAYRKMSELRVHMKTMHNLDPRNLVKVRVESPSRSTKVTVDNL